MWNMTKGYYLPFRFSNEETNEWLTENVFREITENGLTLEEFNKKYGMISKRVLSSSVNFPEDNVIFFIQQNNHYTFSMIIDETIPSISIRVNPLNQIDIHFSCYITFKNKEAFEKIYPNLNSIMEFEIGQTLFFDIL